MSIQILPSLLAADYGRLADEIKRVASSGADALHVDVMDPNFVPNMSFSPDMVALARNTAPALYRNVHLMMRRPDRYLEMFADAGAETIQIHVEADCDLHRELRRIRSLGLKAAIVINPETPFRALVPYFGEFDEALVMTVHPGHGGQKFMAECLEKTRLLREKMPTMDIMVDGGVNFETAVLAARSGVNQFVSGSFLFRADDMASAIAELRARIVESSHR